ncbi:MAG: cytidylate kinase-like family protein [Nibricoccus sp.]
MKTHPGLETAGAYLHAHIGNTGVPWASRAEGPFVTISRESGAGGSTLARALALRLNAHLPDAPQWTVYTGNLIEEMLQSHQLSPRLARFLPEDKIPEISAAVGELVGLHPNLWDLVQKANELMRRLARGGFAIFVGRGANFATAGISHGVHVRLVGPVPHRAKHIARLQQMDETEATGYNAKRDLARERYVRTHFNANIADPNAYDLVIDTSRVHLSEATELAATLVFSRMPVPPAAEK